MSYPTRQTSMVIEMESKINGAGPLVHDGSILNNGSEKSIVFLLLIHLVCREY